jgi:uncharacterized protein YcbX
MHRVTLDRQNRTVRPADLEGDRFFGLEPGTNGTAAEARRHVAPAGFTWRRHDGSHALGVLLVPGPNRWSNPWP